MAESGSILGNPVIRREDPGILVGETEYLDDLEIDGLLHVAFVRSTIAHARIELLEVDEARAMPGVAAVYVAGDLDIPDHHGFVMLPTSMNRPPLARGKVRFVGDIVAMVIAESKAQALDAAETVIVEYDPLPAVADIEAALEPGAPIVHEDHGSNVANAMGTGPVEGILDEADVVVSQRIVNQRLAAVPMEPNGMIAIPGDPIDGMTLWVSTQGPHAIRDAIAPVLGLEPQFLRARCAAVGGGFGPKQGMYVEFLLVSKAAQVLDRPVKWAETRSENMLAMNHGRAQVSYAELGLKRDGTIVGLRVKTIGDAGAYPVVGAFLPFFTQMMSQQVYRTPQIDFNWQAATTNTTPIAAYRGAGRPEATHIVERMLDIAADELEMDPVDIRRVNFIPADAFPYTTVTGATYDCGDYEKPLDAVLEQAGYAALRAEQAARRERNDPMLLGIGLASYVEITAPVGLYREWGRVEIADDGKVLAYVGTSSHGQGHETAFSMIASDVLGVPMEQVTILQSDTAIIPQGGGTGGSRSLQIAGSAVKVASEEVLHQAKQLAAHILEANPDDIVTGGGGLQVAGVPARTLSWADLATAVQDDARRPDSLEAQLAHELTFDAGSSSFPFGAHIAVVEIDRETGRVELLRHIAVDDCGTIVNPLLVKGQQHGGLAQGAAQVLFEHVQYDEDANPITGNLMDYAMPSAAEFPSFEVYNTETPSPLNPLGAKGIGESATIGSTPAVHNAVVDALSHLGIRHVDMPCTAEKVWRAIQEADAQ